MASISATATSSALRNLQAIGKELTATQARVSTGLKVASARDNASVWATAQNLRKDISKESAINSDLTIVKGRADLTIEALDKIGEILVKMKDVASGFNAAAAADDADDVKNKQISKELDAYQLQLTTIVESTSFGGVNWLKKADAAEITLSTSGSTDNKYTFTPTTVFDSGEADTQQGALEGVIEVDVSGIITGANVLLEKAKFDTAIDAVKTYTSKLAGLSDTISMQQDFLSKMSAIRQEAIGQLVDADMTAESAKLSALQVREQLTYQTLATINASSQNILRLFQ